MIPLLARDASSQSPVPSEWMSSIIIEPQPDGCLGVCQESHITKPVKDASQEIIDIEKKKLRQLELQNDNFAAIRRLEYQVEKLNDNVFTLQTNLGSKLDRLSGAVENYVRF
ncbi:unnamed protein product [Meganyctiphanes norvegica]|uniref:Uncharacterized protein n=1 Tax=Meganyctiphanes norvegica TaxID=48144 RepID=A0AAV2RFV5_MEGNR